MPETFLTLLPPLFNTSGKPATVEEAVTERLWIATANLWVIQTDPIPAIVYQQRGMTRKWAPGKLDVLVGGKVNSGEKPVQALIREAKEEMNLVIEEKDINFVGKNLHVGILGSSFLHTIPHIFITKDNRPLTEYTLQKEEVDGIFALPIDTLVKLHNEEIDSFETEGLSSSGNKVILSVTREIFPENWDNYHKKIALLAKKFIAGEKITY